LSYADGEIEDTAINLTHINLQKLFAFLDMEGLEGTGFIDFHLPAGSHGSAIHIIDGTFTSTGPGRLAYSKGNMASTNIGLLALDNFHYKELSGKIAYDSTGPYKITIHLDGSNPDLYNGYPVIFNLTINGSLPELFEAMFLTGSFTGPSLVVGFIIGYGCLAVVQIHVEELRGYAQKVPKLIGFSLFFIWEVFKSNAVVAYDVATPNLKLNPGVVAVPLEASSSIAITIFANFITLTPGTLSLDISDDRSVLFVHAMYLDDEEGLLRDFKKIEDRIIDLLS
jgi:multicomponent Na+:H+ antiporter subunit E